MIEVAGYTKLNLCCGDVKWEGFCNIDMNPDLEPDKVIDIRYSALPFDSSSINEVLFMHAIEHIEKRFHKDILYEINRVLKTGGKLVLAYPEFQKVIENWIKDYKGKRDFWEACVYGRQMHKGDYHVCAIDTEEFKEILFQLGFSDFHATVENEANSFYTVLIAKKIGEVIARDTIGS